MNVKTIVFAGPSAVGKTYIADKLMRDYPDLFEQAKLYTTRKPRISQKATDRIFVSENEYEAMLKNDDFLVSENFGGNRYGYTHESLYPQKNTFS